MCGPSFSMLERYLKLRREGLDVGNDYGNKLMLIFPKIFHHAYKDVIILTLS